MSLKSKQDKLDALKARILKAQTDVKAPEQDADKQESVRGVAAQMMRIGGDFVATILTAILIGWALDRALGWQPWGMLTFLVLGFCSAMLRLARLLAQSDGDDKTDNKTDNAKE